MSESNTHVSVTSLLSGLCGDRVMEVRCLRLSDGEPR